MRFIRVFLWGLTAAMTLQGFLHADEYGSAPSMIGGVSLTMSVWQESLWAGMKKMVSSAPAFVPLPRALVTAALQETARHPALGTLPQLKQVLAAHRRTWMAFREAEVAWMLRHADLVGAVTAERQDLWGNWSVARDEVVAAIAIVQKDQCWSVQRSMGCAAKKMKLEKLEGEAARLRAATDAWDRILAMDGSVGIMEWWGAIAVNGSWPELAGQIDEFHARLRGFHDIDVPKNRRIQELFMFAATLSGDPPDPMLRRLVESLLARDLWTACLDHVRRREGRIQELMVAAGVKDMFNAHERVLNASLRVDPKHRDLIQDWFGEMLGYAWWLGDDVPAVVRRCVAQEAGDCRRIGPTEIVSLSDQFNERSRIVEDWSRRLFIGMWNALPAVTVLFVVEVIVLCVGLRRPVFEVVEVPKMTAGHRVPALQN
jgi:hypothetical protein